MKFRKKDKNKEPKALKEAKIERSVDAPASADVARAKTSRPIALALGVMAFAVLIVVCVLLKKNNDAGMIDSSEADRTETLEDGSIVEPLGLSIPGEGKVATEKFENLTEGDRPIDYIFTSNGDNDFEMYIKCDDGTNKQVTKKHGDSGVGSVRIGLKKTNCYFEVTQGADNVFWEASIMVQG